MRKLYKRIYRYFAVKHPGIRREYGPYVKEHMEEHRNHPWKHRWMLIRLNWHYRVLGRKDTLYYDGTKHRKDAKLPYLEGPESEISKRRNPIHLARELISSYDVISFDIFDTLILRPFSKPADLFMLIGKRLNQAEFYRIRTDAEKRAREKAKLEKGSSEITIRDIYAIIQDRTGIPIEQGVQTEFEMELQYCFANPYMKRVFRLLQEHEKTIVIVSDMYLPHDMMSKLLENAGYTGYDKLYVSCDYGCSKRSKSLYQYVKRDYPYQKIVHIGDNRDSDIDSAQQIGLNTIYYKNCHEIGNPYRADGFSPLVGSAYAGIVNTHLHNGVHTYSPYYEYGFTYGGLYIFGFCNWMHQKAKEEGIEKILFLSRDGAIYQRVFNKFFGDVPNEYFLWSRIANTKYTLLKNREDFLKRMVQYRSKSIVPSTVKALLRMLSLEMFIELLPKYNLKPETLVTPEVVQQLDRFFIENWELICKTYEPERQMVKDNLASKIGNAKKVAIVDVGWLGSGPRGLKYLIEEEYQWNCRVYCWQVAARPPYITDIEGELMDEIIEPYMFSIMYNRNHFDTHQRTNRGVNNLFFELFTQDVTPSYSGFSRKGKFLFDIPEVWNYSYIKEIHEGILDFCSLYYETFQNDPVMFNISGYNAYLPYRFIVRNLAFVKKYFSEFSFARIVGGDYEHQRLDTIEDLLKEVGL